MPDTGSTPQTTFDPHYEWQGEHYEWQGSAVRSIQDNINPGQRAAFPPALLSPTLPEPESSPDAQVLLAKRFAIMVALTPLMLVCSVICPPFFLCFIPMLALCGLGGLILPFVGLGQRSPGLFVSGVFGLSVFALFCYAVYKVFFSGMMMPC